MRVKVNVLKADIKNGFKCSPRCCPIARAAYRAGILHEGVGPYDITIGGTSHNLPSKASLFISKFDANKPVKPFSFTLTKL